MQLLVMLNLDFHWSSLICLKSYWLVRQAEPKQLQSIVL